MAQTETHWFPDGDYAERLQRALDALRAAERDRDSGNRPPLLNGEIDPVDMLSDEYRELRDEAKRDAELKGRVYTLQAINRPGWRLLKGNHPVRTEGDPDVIKQDRLAGLNADTVEDDLVHASLSEPVDRACAKDQRMVGVGCGVENPCSNRPIYNEWADSLSEGEFQVVLQQAWGLANVAKYDPKSLPALQTRSNGEN